MKAPIREGEFWTRSAVRHSNDGAPVSAWVSQSLAQDADAARDEFDEVRELALARHKTALFNEAVRIITASEVAR
jgi:hypothetical protein